MMIYTGIAKYNTVDIKLSFFKFDIRISKDVKCFFKRKKKHENEFSR